MTGPEEFETSLSRPNICLHSWLCTHPALPPGQPTEQRLNTTSNSEVGSTLLLPWDSEAWNKEDPQQGSCHLAISVLFFPKVPSSKIEELNISVVFPVLSIEHILTKNKLFWFFSSFLEKLSITAFYQNGLFAVAFRSECSFKKFIATLKWVLVRRGRLAGRTEVNTVSGYFKATNFCQHHCNGCG